MCKNPAMPDPGPPRPRRHKVTVLALDQVIGFDLGTAPQVLGAARDAAGNQLYSVRVATPGRRPVRSVAGYQVLPEHGLESLETADTVIVPGIAGDAAVRGDIEDDVRAALVDARARGARLVSICTGAFVLAAAGLLDGRPATTHWYWAEAFRARYPQVDLDPGVLFVDDGDVLTSAGVAAGVDLCLHLVRRDHGSEVANRAARRCVVPPWRAGGQSQYIERPLPTSAAASTTAARQWALEHLDRPLDLAALAARARMSVRTFTRRFRDETGLSPARWVSQQRVEHARHLLETTDLPVDTVARRSGFGTGAALRQQMGAALGVAPSTYRSTFRSAG
jgi:transcriptional regulator GlxA family with amidase domain